MISPQQNPHPIHAHNHRHSPSPTYFCVHQQPFPKQARARALIQDGECTNSLGMTLWQYSLIAHRLPAFLVSALARRLVMRKKHSAYNALPIRILILRSHLT